MKIIRYAIEVFFVLVVLIVIYGAILSRSEKAHNDKEQTVKKWCDQRLVGHARSADRRNASETCNSPKKG